MARPPTKKAASRKRKAPPSRGAARKGTTTPKTKKTATAPPQRPPEVTAAQWAKWSASYKARAARFYRLHPGQPSYRMRGKGAGEHLTRRQRLEARMAAVAARQAKRTGGDATTFLARLMTAVASSPRGEGWFGAYERSITNKHNEWIDAGSPRKGSPKALGYSLDAMADELDEYEGVDWEWQEDDLFYH